MNDKRIVICYDISDTKIRNKTIKILESYGYRIQKSVFKCNITMKDFIQLKIKLGAIQKYNKDTSILMIEIKNENDIYFIGKENITVKENINNLII